MENPSPGPKDLHIVVTYNERTQDTEEQAERLSKEYVEDVRDALVRLGHRVDLLEVSGATPQVVRRIGRQEADLVFNLAEGEEGVWREALYPMLFEFLRLPYTGAGPGTLALGLDKRLSEEALALKGVNVPQGALITREDPKIPENLRYPLLIKPNFEGSSIGIHQDSIVDHEKEAQQVTHDMLEKYPDGLDVEEYIRGRELTVGFLAAKRPPFTEIVEYRIDGTEHNILDYETKQEEGANIETVCPAPLSPEQRERVMDQAARAVSALNLPDFGRVDFRLREDGKPFLIEVNPLAGLRRISPLVVGANAQGCSYKDIMGLIVKSAAQRYQINGWRRPT
jgi:D-alanine--D-alanine ligase